MNIARRAPGAINVLVVEDDPELCARIVETLEIAGYIVVTAVNGVEGLNILQDMEADLIICSRSLRRMSGEAFLARIRGAYPQYKDVPFILLAHEVPAVDEQKNGKASDFKPFKYLKKPLDMAKLISAVNHALRIRKMRI